MPALEIVKGAASAYSGLAVFSGSSFLRVAYVVAGAVMLRMSRCVSLLSLRLCGVHVVGGLRTRMPAVGPVSAVCPFFLVLPVLFSLVFCSSPLLLSFFLFQPQPVERQTP